MSLKRQRTDDSAGDVGARARSNGNGSDGDASNEGGDDDDDDEVDPLEAFMAEVDATEEVVPQQSVYGIASQQAERAPPPTLSAANTISLDDLMRMSSAPSTTEGEGWESDTTASEMEEEVDEEQQERDRIEFMKAIRGLHGAPVAASTGAAAEPTKSSTLQEDKESTTPRVTTSSAAAEDEAETPVPAKEATKREKQQLGRMFGDEGDVMEEHEREGQERSAMEMLQEAIKKKELAPVDHTLIDYLKVRKNLYVVPRALADLLKPGKETELAAKRENLGIKVRGKGCPPPVETWEHCGLPDKILRHLYKVYGEKSAPFAVQKQAVPTIMSGRDVIGIAKTGSGKTLAFLLPMLRHIMDQPELGEGEGPIGLIMAPARELAIQIYNEARKFTKVLNFRVTAVYGGASVADQIGHLKRGADIVVCTPGRMIDILTMQAGKLISLSRVSFVVLDEADRMFDLGFEPQIRMILQNIRPDRQTCLFSATFPQKVEALARKVLVAPVEIVVGGRSVVNTSIVQYVEVRAEEDKFMRLLQLLGVWFERGQVLVFVDTQARCERLFEELMRAGYPCLSLHGGKEQIDRDDAIASFKNKMRTLMVATSVAGRGLDVADLVCVVNYSCPNHLEEYVHRVGRTGRAERKGTAYTFISPDEEQFAPVLEKALKQSQQEVPEALQAMADSFRSKIDSGQARWASSGFGGTGFKFDPDEKNKAQKMIDMQRRQYEVDQGLRDEADFYSDESGDEEGEEGEDAKAAASATAAAASSAASADGLSSSAVVAAGPLTGETPLERAKRIAAQLAGGGSSAMVAHTPGPSLAVQQALANAKKFAEKVGISSSSAAEKTHWVEELCINEYPQKARWKITHRETIDDVSEKFEVAIISRGNYVAPGKKPGPNEKKLYLSIEGHSDLAVSGARRELTRILNEETMRVGLDPSSRYSVI